MKIRSELRTDNRLVRTIPMEAIAYFDAFAGVALISYEFKWFRKIQFNFHGPEGSLFMEYRDHAVRAYTRGNFYEGASLLMVVTMLSSFGNSHTSIVSGASICDCFNEYMRLSDQRRSIIVKEAGFITRLEALPDTLQNTQNGYLSEVSIDVCFES